MPISITPHRWLDIFDAHLEGEGAKWAGNTPLIRRMLADGVIKRATEADVTEFNEALIARFDTRATIDEVETANIVLESLKQGKGEDVRSYYTRTVMG